MRLFVGSIILILLAILFLGFLAQNDKPMELPTPTPTAVSRQCSEEFIRLAELVLQDPEQYRELYHDRLQELDPSDEVAIAVELQDNIALEKILKETRNACSKSRK